MALKKTILTVNGVERYVVFDDEKDTLATVLRNLGCTGVKVGCGAGMCGACSVILNGEVVRSCTRKMKKIADYSEITTIEGIGTPTNLHPLQLAWIVYGGVQCGFCTPGFIVSAKGLLDTNPNPTREEVRDWFQAHRNACRCTGYKPIVDAVMAAAQVLRGEMTMEDLAFKMPEDQRIWGTYYPRPAALSKVTGTCDYGADINDKLPEAANAVHLALVLSDVGHAMVKNVDFSEAEASDGFIRAITYKDVDGTNRIFWPFGNPRNKDNGVTRPILVEDKVRRYGDVIAIIAADTREHAREAAAKVKVDYDRLPEYMTVLDAVADDAVRIFDEYPNMYCDMPLYKGEETAPIIESAPYVVEGSYYCQHQPHLVMEPDVALSYIDSDGIVTVHCKSLAIHGMPFLSGGTGVPPTQQRCIENPTGASFGYSVSPATYALMVIAANVMKRPCCLQLDYAEHNRFTGKRAAAYTNLKMAADENGKLQAMEFDIAYDKGAYSETGDVATKGLRFVGAPYYVPNVQGAAKLVCTNNPYSTAFRGFGGPQALTASEQAMDELAEIVGMDPLEFRYINVLRPGDTMNSGCTPDVYPMAGLIDKMRPLYEELKKDAEEFNAASDGKLLRGVGVSCSNYNVTGNINDHSEVAMELLPDGRVRVYSAWEDQGQGGDIGTLVHAHESLLPLGLTPDQIHLVMNDTGICPPAGGAASSRSNYMTGNAILDAANKLIVAMKKDDGTYRTYDEMIAEGIPVYHLGIYDTTGMGTPLDPNTGQGDPTPTYTYGFHIAEVEVDTTTGKVKVLSMATASDVGVISSRQALDGQAYGGMQQTLGLALSEDYVDPMKDNNLIKCGFPYIKDCPDEMILEYTETPRTHGPHGASGASEVYVSGGHISIINAIYHACGVRIHELPAKPEKVLAEIKAQAEGTTINPKRYWLGSDLHEMIEDAKKNPIIPGAK